MKYLIISIVSYSLCVAQSFLSLHHLKNEWSSSCLECSLISEISRYSLISLVIIPLFYFFLQKTKQFKIITTASIFIVLCFFVNFIIFQSRVSAWSTFTTLDQLYGVLNLSYLTIIATFILFIILAKTMTNKSV